MVVALRPRPAGDSESAALWDDDVGSRKVVSELALEAQLGPGSRPELQQTPGALQVSVHSGRPQAARIPEHGAVDMSLRSKQHQWHNAN